MPKQNQIVANKFRPALADEVSAPKQQDRYCCLHDMALNHFKAVMAGERSKDIEHWMYEEVMGWLGDGVWEALRR